jgi:hypothetical protein
MESARPKNFDRPWAPNWASASAARENSSGESGKAKTGNRAPNATPRQEDIEADE